MSKSVKGISPAVRWVVSSCVVIALSVALLESAASAKTMLPPEKVARYEKELFSELRSWNHGNRAYPEAVDILMRQARWEAMAAEGFDLARLTLAVVQPSSGRRLDPGPVFPELIRLAESGNRGAMCLMYGLLNVAAAESGPYAPIARSWAERGVQLGHPQCMSEIGRRTLIGVPGFEKNVARGLALEFDSKGGGYEHDFGALILHFESVGVTSQIDASRLYCWKFVDDLSLPAKVSKHSSEALLAALEKAQDVELRALVPRLRGRTWSVKDCLGMGAWGHDR